MSTTPYLRSFAGGEISPELVGRLDLTKNQTGVAKALNFVVLPHGPAQNRPGTDFVINAKYPSKKAVLLPFIYNTAQAYVLEFGDQYMRIHLNGGVLLNTAQAISDITQANPGVVTYVGADNYANGDWVWLSAIAGMLQLNGRFCKVANVNTGANTFELTDLDGNNIDTTGYSAYTGAGMVSEVYEIATPYLEADLFDLHFTQSNDVLTIVHPSYQQRELTRASALSWALNTFSLVPTQEAPTALVVTPAGAGGVTYTYQVTAIGPDGIEESLAPGTPGTNAACADLSTAGAYNTITWTNAPNAVRYNVYKLVSGLYGFIGQASGGGTGFKDNNITPDMTLTPPIANDPFPSAGNYPAAVAYYKQRRTFAGTTNKPLNLYMTRAGTESNMTYSIPTQDDDSITLRLTSLQNNAIRHLVPLGDLLALTAGSEWAINSGGGGAPLTPSTVDAGAPQGYSGAGAARPVVTSKTVVYTQAVGGRIREMKYNLQSNGYDTNDISVMAPHLFDGYTITSMTFVRAPNPCIWMTRSDGLLIGLTYLPEHEVFAFHKHDTGASGAYEHVCAIPEGTEDRLYAVVKRTINGTVRRFIERLHTRQVTAQEDYFMVDCGLTYSGPAATTISGLWHLIGQTVSILSNGAVEPQQVVAADGTVTLTHSTTKAHVGIPIIADFQTLPPALEAAAFGQAMKTNINKVHLRVLASGSIFVGPAFDKLKEVKTRTTEPYGTPPALRTGVFNLMMSPQWTDDGGICIRQPNPLPITILSIAPDVATGG